MSPRPASLDQGCGLATRWSRISRHWPSLSRFGGLARWRSSLVSGPAAIRRHHASPPLGEFKSPLRHHLSHARHAHRMCPVSWFSGPFTALIVRRVVEWLCESTPTPDTAVVAFALVTHLQPNDECPAASDLLIRAGHLAISEALTSPSREPSATPVPVLSDVRRHRATCVALCEMSAVRVVSTNQAMSCHSTLLLLWRSLTTTGATTVNAGRKVDPWCLPGHSGSVFNRRRQSVWHSPSAEGWGISTPGCR